jgi:hypothetical protein
MNRDFFIAEFLLDRVKKSIKTHRGHLCLNMEYFGKKLFLEVCQLLKSKSKTRWYYFQKEKPNTFLLFYTYSHEKITTHVGMSKNGLSTQKV